MARKKSTAKKARKVERKVRGENGIKAPPALIAYVQGRLSELGMTQARLARETGWDDPSQAGKKIKAGTWGLRDDDIKSLAKVLKCEESTLRSLWLGSSRQPPGQNQARSVSGAVQTVPIINRAAAGAQLDMLEFFNHGHDIATDVAFVGALTLNNGDFAIKIDGDALHPKVMDGDILVFSRIDTEIAIHPLRDGDIAFMVVNDTITIGTAHRVSGNVRVRPINPAYSEVTAKQSHISVLAVAVELRVGQDRLRQL